jgi:hypothetical protein
MTGLHRLGSWLSSAVRGTRRLVAGAGPTGGWHSQLIVKLVQTCADDTLRLTGLPR